MKTLVILTDQERTFFKIGIEDDINRAIGMDEGVVSPSMGLPRKYWYEDCIVLTVQK